MIGQRAFITLLGGAATWPLVARAQLRESKWCGNDESSELLPNADVLELRRQLPAQLVE